MSQQVVLLFSHLNWWMVLLPLPFFIASLIDVIGWKKLLPNQAKVPLVPLLGIHVGSEAILQSVPGGFALTDALKTILLKRRLQVLAFDTVGSLIIRHWMIGLAQIIFILSALALNLAARQPSTGTLFAPGSALVVSFGLLLGVTAGLGAVVQALRHGSLASTVWKQLCRLPINSLRRWLKTRQSAFLDADAHFKTVGGKSRWMLLSVLGFYILLWSMEACETLLVAQSLGFSIGFVNALAMEALLSALKLAVFFLPAGIGAKDLGYFGLFASFGISATTLQIGTFVILKRLVLLFWIAVGYLILLVQGVRPRLRHELANPTAVEVS